MTGIVVLAAYFTGLLVTALVTCRYFAKSGPLDLGDVGGALFFGLGWPVLAPFAALVWAFSRALPLFGIEVKR